MSFSYDFNGQLLIDFSQCEAYFNDLLQKYGIKRSVVHREHLQFEKPVLLPCDSFYLSYSKQNYQKYHLEHFVLIQEFCDEHYYIYDDNPAYEGWLPQAVIHESYEHFRHQIIHYEPIVYELDLTAALAFFQSTWHTPSSAVSSFIENLVDSQLSSEKILRLIEEARIPFKRYHAIINCAHSLSAYHFNVDLLMEAATKYTDELTFLSNLASVGLRSPERYIGRIRSRISKLQTLELMLFNEINKMKVVLCGDTS